MRRDQAARADHRAVEHGRVVGDHRLGADVHAVDDAAVRDRRPRSDVDGNAGRGVQHAAVLHVGAFADDDGREVAAQYGVEPHRGARLDGTSPISVAVGAMKRRGRLVGDRPSNVNSGIV